MRLSKPPLWVYNIPIRAYNWLFIFSIVNLKKQPAKSKALTANQMFADNNQKSNLK